MDELDDAIEQYPKAKKFTLGKETDKYGLYFYELIVAAGKKYFKKTTLHDADVKLDILKHLIRRAKKKHYIGIKRYARLCSYIEEIGSMLGGWIKSMDKK